MKSIKEKAKEYVSDRPDGIIKTRVKEGYVAGANYALEQIENLIQEKSDKGYLPLFNLTFLIDRLRES